MKIIGIEEEGQNKKELNPKKALIVIIIVMITIITIILKILYSTNHEFRNLMDKYVLMKNVMENALTSIPIEESKTNGIYAYDKYIAILSQNKLLGYNSLGNKEYEIPIEATNPIVDTNGRFLIIAEVGKQKVYLVSGNTIAWEQELEGNISRVSVNKNGYSSIVLSGTTHKSVIQTFDSKGKTLFKTYLSNSIAVDTDISNDNRYLSFAEVSTTGTLMQSMIKTISIQKAKENKEEAIIHTYTVSADTTILNIKYQDSNRLVCMFDNEIHVLQDEKDETIFSLNDENKRITFADIELNNNAYIINEKKSLLSTETTVEIQNVISKKTNIYQLDSGIKEVYAYNDKIALNLGAEVHIIGMNGWLNRKYTSTQEIKKIVMANNCAGIVYRDKIEIVNL